jgi:hypothetical protein
MPAAMAIRRWREQRWLLDAVVRMVGVECDQGRLSATVGCVGVDLLREPNQIRERVKKFSDITKEFTKLARLSEEHAMKFEKEGHLKTAEENYLAASVLYGGALWPHPFHASLSRGLKLLSSKRSIFP